MCQGHSVLPQLVSQPPSHNMEAFIDIITTLETVITEDLDNLSMSSTDRQTQETVDRICISYTK